MSCGAGSWWFAPSPLFVGRLGVPGAGGKINKTAFEERKRDLET